MRPDRADKPVHSIIAHQSEVNSLAFNPHNDFILATGAGDKVYFYVLIIFYFCFNKAY